MGWWEKEYNRKNWFELIVVRLLLLIVLGSFIWFVATGGIQEFFDTCPERQVTGDSRYGC